MLEKLVQIIKELKEKNPRLVYGENEIKLKHSDELIKFSICDSLRSSYGRLLARQRKDVRSRESTSDIHK